METSDVTHAHPHPELISGVEIGPWRVLERRDRGSFGVVFRVERAGHPEAGSFALKVALRPDDPRFEREVSLLQRASHPSIPRFEDRGAWKDSEGLSFPFIVMEWVEGRPLYEWARKNRITSAQVLHICAQLAGAIAAAHAAGGLHRDVKGGNILVTTAGRAVLLDWGGGTHQGAKEITDTCLPPGTYSYRTPEALRWSWAHRKTGVPYVAGSGDDVYALGVAMYRLCTGSYPPQPTEGSGPQRRLLPPCELATVSVGLEQFLLACLSESHQERPLADALALGLSAAAREPDAVRPIVPTPAAAPTDTRPSTGSEEWRWEWPSWVSTALIALGGGLVAGFLVLLSSRCINRWAEGPPLSMAEWSGEPRPEAPDGGVGEALLSVSRFQRPSSPTTGVSLPMPKAPLPGQKKPPCDGAEVESLGACWLVLGRKPPCESLAYELDGLCVRASYDAPRQPTSKEPQ